MLPLYMNFVDLVESIYLQPRVASRLFCPITWYDVRTSMIARYHRRKRLKIPTHLISLCIVDDADLSSVDNEDESIKKTSPMDAMVDKFIRSVDPLQHFAIANLFNPVHSCQPPDHIQMEVLRLRDVVNIADSLFGPTLCPLESINYHAMIPTVTMPSAYSCIDSDSMPIVIDTGASRSLSPH